MAVDIIARAMAANASGGSKDVDYNSVINKPQINGVTLEGNKTTSDLGIGEIPSFIGTQDSPINLASNDIVKNPICFVSGYIPDNPSGYGYDFKSPIILLNTTNKNETWSDTRSKIQCLYEGYVKSGDSYSPLKVWTRTLEFNESTNSWKVKNGYTWEMTSANYLSIPFYTTLYKNYLFDQKGAYDMYRELMSYLTDTVSNKPLLSDLKTTDKKSLVNAINELVDIKQDKLTAGSGITIENNVISALGGGDTEVKILSGDYYNPIKLYEITEQGKYLLNGYAKKRETDSSPDSYDENKFVLIVLNVNNTIFQYIVGIFNYQLRLKYRIGTEGRFNENYIASKRDTFEPYNDITIYTGKQIGEYYGNKYQLTTTDKTSLVNAINEINAKISSGTFATNLTEVQGYDATKTQVLKNINGQFTWADES